MCRNSFIFRNIISVPLMIFIVSFLGGCQTGSDRSEVSSHFSPKDLMSIVKTDSVYRVALNGEDCMQFSTPELMGCGLPRIEVAMVEDGWQQVHMWWDVPQEIVQDELSIRFDLAIEPDFLWAPASCPL